MNGFEIDLRYFRPKAGSIKEAKIFYLFFILNKKEPRHHLKMISGPFEFVI